MNHWLKNSPTPLVIGHRGASHGAPENTMAAFRLAKEEGADGIEFDVYPSADGVPVIIHDQFLERTTSGHGRVYDWTATDLNRLDAGEGEILPTLEMVFADFGRSFLYNIEIKDRRWRNHGTEQTVANLISAHDLADYVTISSFSPLVMGRARSVMPPGVLLAQLRDRGFMRYSHLLFSGDADHPHYKMVDEAYIKWARRRNYRVHVWTVDNLNKARRLKHLGVDAIITNTPAKIRQAL